MRQMADASTSTSDLLSGYNDISTQTSPSNTNSTSASDSDSEPDSDFSLVTPHWSPVGAVLSIAEDTDAPPSHPPDGLEIQPIPGPSNWIPPGVVEGNTWSQWTWDREGSPSNLTQEDRPRRSITYHSLQGILGTHQDNNQEEDIPDDFFDIFIDNLPDTSSNDDQVDQDLAQPTSPSLEYCPSNCSSEKENWPPSPRALTPTPPHSPMGEEEEEEDVFDMGFNLED